MVVVGGWAEGGDMGGACMGPWRSREFGTGELVIFEGGGVCKSIPGCGEGRRND